MHKTLNGIVVFMFLLLAACANEPNQPREPEIGQVSETLIGPGFCNTYPALCQAWCDNHPVACGKICNRFPQLAMCQGEPSCVALGDNCVDEEDPNFVPCCGEEDGSVGCFLDFANNERVCAERVQCEPGQPSINQECDPNGVPCCQSPNPFDPISVNCEASDPSDPETSYICTPSP